MVFTYRAELIRFLFPFDFMENLLAKSFQPLDSVMGALIVWLWLKRFPAALLPFLLLMRSLC